MLKNNYVNYGNFFPIQMIGRKEIRIIRIIRVYSCSFVVIHVKKIIM